MRRALATVAVVVALPAFAGCGFGEDQAAAPAAALTPPESSWLPGQKALGEYPEFAEVFGRAVDLATRRHEKRELELERIERERLAARKRADAAAQRRYLEAKRRAEAAYKRALEEAARKRREQEQRRREIMKRIAAVKRARERKLRVEPGEECRLRNVRRRFRCRTGRLPDPQTERGSGRD